MANSLLTGISGLRSHQKMLEVIGNNLANVNTTSFKASRALFADLMYELQRGPTSASTGIVGSVNALQIGTGSRIAAVDKDFSQGNLEQTGQPLDMAIDGEGFFVLSSGQKSYYTRRIVWTGSERLSGGSGHRKLRSTHRLAGRNQWYLSWISNAGR